MFTRSIQPARYLLRFDDLCSTMDWALWDEVEGLLLDAGIKPILAVIPENLDPKLMTAPPSATFWNRVRNWQARGWSIGLHGYQHTYVNAEAGILRLNRRSEFAGLSYEDQFEKLRKGLEIFDREGVHADAWVAPAHSFDWVTVSALTALGIHVISDGMALGPYRDPHGNVWIPQQFANMRPMPFGIWTFCYHPQALTPGGMILFRRRLKQLSPRMISLQEAMQMGTQPRSTGDRLVGALRQAVSGIRRLGQ
jgi:peptidoglycan/xylan/chitin deacetylase (PgdA/CDA1 family)